ncbi:DNA-binding transcriptional regulator, LysR family [Rhizobium sp. NFR07]|uniref:LysR family transcriptional regulator n=1 Tax=Rhizobium sp. NFR07 TaxID=1566262 RepID=UPI0008F09386|nr:LysR family transcriptional regulator [Rhizobium sp. NFR07]SFB42254.1 DNA-binding transcriptional regulator, LysR family [Rhizobium sp. NFR07]
MDINTALKAFIRTVERGSITSAARDLGVSQPAVTKHLANLERHLKTRLLERSSRSIRPTIEGMELYEASRLAIASIDAALEGAMINTGEISGNLRIHAPSCIGAQHLQVFVGDFQDQHPAVTIELVLDDRIVDLIYDNFDLTLRYGKILEQEVVARRVGWVRRFLVASPEYLEKAGPVYEPQSLSNLNVIATLRTPSNRGTVSFYHDSGRVEVVSINPVLKTNSAQVMTSAILRGRGIGLVQQNLVTDLLRRGEVVRVLPDYTLESSEAFLAYPSTKFMRPVVRAFTDFVMPRLRALEGLMQNEERRMEDA